MQIMESKSIARKYSLDRPHCHVMLLVFFLRAYELELERLYYYNSTIGFDEIALVGPVRYYAELWYFTQGHVLWLDKLLT